MLLPHSFGTEPSSSVSTFFKFYYWIQLIFPLLGEEEIPNKKMPFIKEEQRTGSRIASAWSDAQGVWEWSVLRRYLTVNWIRAVPRSNTSSQIGSDRPAYEMDADWINNASNLSRRELGGRKSSNEIPNADFLPLSLNRGSVCKGQLQRLCTGSPVTVNLTRKGKGMSVLQKAHVPGDIGTAFMFNLCI